MNTDWVLHKMTTATKIPEYLRRANVYSRNSADKQSGDYSENNQQQLNSFQFEF